MYATWKVPKNLLLFLIASAVSLKPETCVAGPPVTATTFSVDGAFVLFGSQSGVEVRSWPELLIVESVKTELEHIHDLRFSPDGRTLLIAGGSPAEKGLVEVVSWPERITRQRVLCHDDSVYRIIWCDNGNRWASAGGDQFCCVYQAGTGERMCRFEGHSGAVLALTQLHNSSLIASVGVDQTMRVWNLETGKLARTLDNHVGAVTAIMNRPALQQTGSTLVATASEDKTVRFWQPETGRMVRFTRLPSIAGTLAWSASGEYLFAGCDDGKVRVVKLETAEIVETIPALDGRINELCLSPLSADLIVAGDSGFCHLAIKY